jgi:UrcA family protein
MSAETARGDHAMNAQRTNLSIIVAATLCTSLSLSQIAAGEEPERATHVARTIDLSGLNLSSAAGAQRLYRQIVAAAEDICGSSSRYYKGVTRVKHESEHVQPCIDAAVNGALQKVADQLGLDLEGVAGLDRSHDGLRAAR